MGYASRDHYTHCAGSVTYDNVRGTVLFTRVPPHPYTVIICTQTIRDSSLKTTFRQSVAFHIARAWYHCRRSRRCSGCKGRARKGCLDFRFAFARHLEIVFVTTATPTSAFIVKQVTVGSTSACRTILRSSLFVVLLVAPDPIPRTWVPSRVYSYQHFLRHTMNDLPGRPYGALTSLQFSCRWSDLSQTRLTERNVFRHVYLAFFAF